MSIKSKSLKLSPQAYYVLDELRFQYSHCSLNRIGDNLNIPFSSVRRSIQELRRAGYDITLAGGVLRLHRG